MTDKELAEQLTKVSTRYNEALYAQPGSSTDGIQNLSDIKEEFGRRNGENWLVSFNYKKGDIATYSGSVFISEQDDNIGNIPGASSAWVAFNSVSLVNGSFFACAFCNFNPNIAGISVTNNFNIASVTNIINIEAETTTNTLYEIKFAETANISNSEYMVFAVTSNSYTGSYYVYGSPFKPQNISTYQKRADGFILSMEMAQNAMVSVLVVPKQ